MQEKPLEIPAINDWKKTIRLVVAYSNDGAVATIERHVVARRSRIISKLTDEYV